MAIPEDPKVKPSLYQVAQRLKVPFSRKEAPVDKFIAAVGLQLHFLEWGGAESQSEIPKRHLDSEPVLLLHGLAQQAHSWDLISLALCHQYRVLALDARGHGDSQWDPKEEYGLDAHQRDLDAFAEANKLRNFILVGLSMGGRNAYVFASRRPDLVKALVIVDIGPEESNRGRQRIRNFIALPDELGSYEEFARRVEEYTGRPSRLVNAGLQHSLRQLPNGNWTWKYDSAIRSPNFNPQTWPPEELWGCLEKIKCPTLVVRGAKSDVLPVGTFERMLKVIHNSRGAVISRAGHLVPGDNPVDFLKALKLFLQSLDQGPAHV